MDVIPFPGYVDPSVWCGQQIQQAISAIGFRVGIYSTILLIASLLLTITYLWFKKSKHPVRQNIFLKIVWACLVVQTISSVWLFELFIRSIAG